MGKGKVPQKPVGVTNWFWDAREGKVVDERPKWWDERRKELGRLGHPKVTPIATYTLKGNPKGGKMVEGFRPQGTHLQLSEKPDEPCDAVVDVGDCYITPNPAREEKKYGSTYDTEPWKKINRRMWPTVWKFYVRFYYSGEYYAHTRNTDFYKNNVYTGGYHHTQGSSYKPGGTPSPGSGTSVNVSADVKEYTEGAMEAWRKANGSQYDV